MDRIEPGPFRELGYQAALTARLRAARPVLEDDPPSDWIGAVEDALATPIVVTSSGPSTRDKRELRLDVTV